MRGQLPSLMLGLANAPTPTKMARRVVRTEVLSPHCTVIQADGDFTVALNPQGNDPGRVNRTDAWKLLALLEAFIRDTGGPS